MTSAKFEMAVISAGKGELLLSAPSVYVMCWYIYNKNNSHWNVSYFLDSSYSKASKLLNSPVATHDSVRFKKFLANKIRI